MISLTLITVRCFKQSGELMKNLLQCSIFIDLENQLNEIAKLIHESKVIHLMAPADIEGVLALAQMESALLDNSQNYLKNLSQKTHVGRDHTEEIPEVDGLIIHIDPFFETQRAVKIEQNYIHIVPLSVSLTFPSSSREHNGAVDCVGFVQLLQVYYLQMEQE